MQIYVHRIMLCDLGFDYLHIVLKSFTPNDIMGIATASLDKESGLNYGIQGTI